MPIEIDNSYLLQDNFQCLFENGVHAFEGDCFLELLWRAVTVKYNKSNWQECKKKSKVYVSGGYDSSAYLSICTARYSQANEYVSGEGWETFDSNAFPLNRYLSQFCKTKVFVSKELKMIHIFTDGVPNAKWSRALASCFGRLLTWYYPSQTKEIESFYRSLAVDSKEYTESQQDEILTQFANSVVDQEELRKGIINLFLTGYENGRRERKLNSLRSTLEERRRSLQNCYISIESILADIENANCEYNALINAPVGEDGAFIEFFEQHKNIRLINANKGDGSIEYQVTDTLEYYDEDELKSTLNNKYSWMCTNFTQRLLQIVKWLFVEKRGVVNVSAVFRLSSKCLVRPISDTWCDKRSTFPNPHLYFYGCNGANDKYYYQYAESGDWELGIEQSISATKNWSVGDSAVGRRMFDLIGNSLERVERKFIFIKDGSPMDGNLEGTRRVSVAEFEQIVMEKIKKEEEESQNG